MKRAYLFILLAAVVEAGIAQSIGPQIDKTGDQQSELKELVPFPGRGFATLAVDRPSDPTELEIRFFNLSESLLGQRKISLSDRGLPAQVEGAFRWGDYLVVLTSLYYPGPRRNNLLLRQYSLPNLEEVASVQVAEAYTPANLRIPFGYSLSPDSTRLLCYAWSYSLPNDPVRLNLRVLDEALQTEWQRDYLLPYRNETFYLYGCLLDRKGGAWLLGEDYQGEPSRFSGVDEQKIRQIILYGGESYDKPREFAVQPGRFILSGVRFTLDNNDQLVGAGFYRQRGKTRLDGVYTLRVDGASDQIRNQLIPVGEEIFDASWQESFGRAPRGQRGSFQSFTVDQLFARDSVLILTGEQVIDPSSSYVYTPMNFISNEIIVVQIRNDRKLDWISRIPKRQEGAWGDLPKFSYSCFYVNETLNFFFNNISSSEGNTNWASVDAGGQVAVRDITEQLRRGRKMVPYPARTWMMGKEAVLFSGVEIRGIESNTVLIGLRFAEIRN